MGETGAARKAPREASQVPDRPRSRMRFVQHRPAPEPEPELEELEEIPRVEVAAREEREAPEEAREELQRRQIFKSAMKKEALAQQSPPPSPPSPLSPRIQLDVSGESGDELSEMAGITKPRVGHRAFGSLSASPLQLGPRSPPDSPGSSH
ncbi:unnamed protein product [Effrenium voratum]|nr:unnamed protein product [Effrenium voratum]